MRKRNKKDGWYIQRGYSHIDRPLSYKAANALVKNTYKIGTLPFFPLLGYSEKKRRLRLDPSQSQIPRPLRRKIIKWKTRDIKYASHRDSYIYSYYAKILNHHYETYLKTNSVSENVVGYRKGLGSNIDIAARAFAEIASRGNCNVYCFDIKDFFPSIPHKSLKFSLCDVLGTKFLDAHWYNIYRSITRFSWIEVDQLYLWLLIDPKKFIPNPLCLDVVELLDDLRANGMIRTNRADHGIPQGTPISAIMANVSMPPFDIAARDWCAKSSSTFLRYSDDVLFITDDIDDAAMVAAVQGMLQRVGNNINLSHDKTEISRFRTQPGGITVDVPISYLGFTFDGVNIRIRSQTLSKYYRRMTYATRRTDKAALKAFKKGGSRSPHLRSLLRDFTYLGKSNFFTYARRAESKFKTNAIKKQMRRHFSIMMRKLRNWGR